MVQNSRVARAIATKFCYVYWEPEAFSKIIFEDSRTLKVLLRDPIYNVFIMLNLSLTLSLSF